MKFSAWSLVEFLLCIVLYQLTNCAAYSSKLPSKKVSWVNSIPKNVDFRFKKLTGFERITLKIVLFLFHFSESLITLADCVFQTSTLPQLSLKSCKLEVKLTQEISFFTKNQNALKKLLWFVLIYLRCLFYFSWKRVKFWKLAARMKFWLSTTSSSWFVLCAVETKNFLHSTKKRDHVTDKTQESNLQHWTLSN